DRIITFGQDALLPIQPPMFDDEDRIVIADGRHHQSFCVGDRRRRHYFKPGQMRESRMHRFAMLVALSEPATDDRADDQRNLQSARTPVAETRYHISQLAHRKQQEIYPDMDMDRS